MLNLPLSLLLLLTLLPAQEPTAQAPTTPGTVKKDAPVEDPAVTLLARKIYSQMRAGKVDEALLTPEMAKALSPETLAQNKPVFDQLGDPTKITLESTEKTPQGTAWTYLATFATAQLHVKVFITPDNKVGGYVLAP